jgi:MFS family permease
LTPEAQSRNVRVFGLTSLLNDTASEMAYWVLPAFIAALGGGPEQLGLIEGASESVTAFAKLFSGRLADRFPRRKPMVVSGYAVANVAKPFLALASSWWHVLLIRFSDRLAKGVRGSPRDVLLSESVPPEKVGAAFGLLQTMDSAGAIAGPLLAMAILSTGHSLRTVFWVAAVPGLLSVIVVTLFARETRMLGTKAPASSKAELDSERHRDAAVGRLTSEVSTSKGTVHKLPAQFYFVLGVLGLFSIGNSSDMFLVLRAQNAGIPVAFAPLLGLVFNVVYTLAAWPAGKLSDRVEKSWVASAGLMVFAIVYATFGRAPSRPALWAAMAFYGLYYALTTPVLKALVSNAVHEDVRGRAFGLFAFTTSVTYLLASLLTGWLWKNFSPATPFYFSAALALIAAVLLPFAPRVASATSQPS